MLSELTAAQRKTFCGRVSDPGAVCEATSQGTRSDKTPVQSCLDSVASLPNCSVAQYQKCMEEAKRDPCGAAATPACQELSTCRGDINAGDACPPGPSESGSASEALKVITQAACVGEIATGIGAIVWAIRYSKDGCSDNYYRALPKGIRLLQYCYDYSMEFDHYKWVKGCMCRN